MKNKVINFLILIVLSFLSCSKSVNKQIEGVYTVDKELLKTKLASNSEPISPAVSRFLEKELENTLMEFQIKKDSSIYGILSFGGEDPILLEDKLQEKNEFLMFADEKFILNRTSKGVSFQKWDTNIVFDFIKTNRTELSSQAKRAIKKETKEKSWRNKYGIWDIHYYNDEFGVKTHEAYVTTTIEGKFSNSATTNSNLKVVFIIDNEQVKFKLFEYGSHLVKDGIYYFKIRYNNSEITGLRIGCNNRGYFYISDYNKKDKKKLRKILLNGGKIEFTGAEGTRFTSITSSTNYKFTIDNASKLKNTLKEMDSINSHF